MQAVRYLISLALVIIACGCASTRTIQKLPAVE